MNNGRNGEDQTSNSTWALPSRRLKQNDDHGQLFDISCLFWVAQNVIFGCISTSISYFNHWYSFMIHWYYWNHLIPLYPLILTIDFNHRYPFKMIQ